MRWKLHLWPRVAVQESTDTPLTHQTSVHMQSDWPGVKDDAVNLALQELSDRKEKESLSLSGLQLAFGSVRLPDNVSSNPLQLLRVTQARPLLCHELSLLSSEVNPQKSFLNKTTQTFTVLCCYFISTIHLKDEAKQDRKHGRKKELGWGVYPFFGWFIWHPFLLYRWFLKTDQSCEVLYNRSFSLSLFFLSLDKTCKNLIIWHIETDCCCS